ncbi:ankyrin repeat/F-box domain-containing protein [Tetraselmis virus 1]|uniref:Ankyrin repeat/F-box domain-containing protein n=1 Tax=Tetraselmis virus 1 TaxID=2060617 RepID=A0A2P0VNZ9_9VIRU|nr:ankyrin repeat/F-box domain-containing protein [Tetraselmis virus 1]AUF82627.1 ankyrin repeat/F-box domain-containing protein [Tetraselmis virus 1]
MSSAHGLFFLPSDCLYEIFSFLDNSDKRMLAQTCLFAYHFVDSCPLIRTIKYVHTVYGFQTCVTMGCPVDTPLARTLIVAGNIQSFKNICNVVSVDCTVMMVAAEHNRLDIVRHLKQHHDIPLSVEIMDSACSGGHINVIRWLLCSHCPIRYETCAVKAAQKGKITVLKELARIHGGDLRGATNAFIAAMQSHQSDTAVWISRNYRIDNAVIKYPQLFF